VLSDSTERIDRREKLLAYTRIDSLQEYLLVSQERPEVEIHRRRDDWRGTIHTEGSIILEFVGIEIPLEQVYEEVPLP
jgi:Uma2 family endonuclease